MPTATGRKTAAEKATDAQAEAADQADATPDTPTEGTEGTTEEAETDTVKRPMPVYGISEEALDELPDSPPAATRDQMFLNLLAPIVQDEDKWGKWFRVATYKTPTGAREAEKAVEKGDRPLPEGQWEHGARRITPELADGETTAHNRWSALFFRYLGPAGEAEVEGAETVEGTNS